MILQKKDILKVMQLLKPGLAKKEIIEQFTHYIFSGEDIVTFNDEICISHPFQTDFKCSAKADELFKIVSGIKEETLDISVTENKMSIKSSKTRASLATSSGDQASQLVAVLDLDKAWEQMLPLPEDFSRGMYLCMFSASKNMTKGIYTCVYVNDGTLSSSDGVRISKYKLNKGVGCRTLVPARNISELIKFPVTKFHLTDSWCHFGTEDGVIFSTRIMEGELPDFDDYFITEGQKVRLPSELKDLVNSVSFMTDGKEDKDKMIFLTVTSNKILCKGEKKEIGELEREIDFEYKQGDFTISINPGFLQEVLEKATIMKVSENAALFLSGTFNHLISLK